MSSLICCSVSGLGKETMWLSLLRTCLDIDVLQISFSTKLTYGELPSVLRTAISMWENIDILYTVL